MERLLNTRKTNYSHRKMRAGISIESEWSKLNEIKCIKIEAWENMKIRINGSGIRAKY